MTHDDEQRSGDADEIWQRLRALEDTPFEDTPLERGAVPPSDSTRMMPAPPPRTRGDGTGVDDLAGASGGDGAPGHYYVPAPQHRPQRSGAPAQPNPASGRAAYEQQQRAAVASNPAGNAGRQGTPTGSAAKAGSARAPQRSGSGGGRLRRWFRPKLRWIVLYLPLLIMASIAALGLWGWKTVKDLGRVDVGDSIVAATGDTVNYLIVGSDSREGAEAEGDAGYIGDTSVVGGQRADTIIVLRVEPTRSLMMSIPRDLWATNVATGKKGRINGTFNQGPDNLVRSVTANLGIPINQYLEVDFVSFAAMVDAMGGVDVEFPHAVFDKGSGLNIIAPGTHTLDGQQALAFVRARHYTEIIDGAEVTEPTGDLGRQQRQQLFIRTVLKTAGAERNPITLARIASGAASGVKVDQNIGFGDLLSLARRLGSGDPETRVLPTENARKGDAAVLVLRDAEALGVLMEFGAG